MKKLLLFILIFAGIISAQSNLYFLSEPSLSPDGKNIVFTYAEDLWIVPSEGGKAYRLTGMQGNETDAVYSPDGKWIAFDGSQDGNSNIYIIPVDGGKIKQLTFYDSGDQVSSWSWDSKYIYFTSSRYNSMSTYKVSINGETPERLFENYFNRPHNLVVNPSTGEYLFNESWESSRFTNRKRYKGAFNPDIKSYNPKTGEFKKLTTWEGKDMWPTVDKSGKIYFVSDEANNEYNLYIFANGNKKQLTNFDTSIKRPRVSANGNSVVFEKDYQLYIYDTATNKTMGVQVDLPENNTLSIMQDFNVKGQITNFDVSPDNKKIAFSSRGLLFVSDIEGKFIRQLNTNPEGRVKEVLWSDSTDIVFTMVVKGWSNLYKINATGSANEEQVTSDERNNRDIELNSDKTKMLYLSGRDQLRLFDMKSLKSETILTDEFWAIQNSQPHFSPDDKWIAYTAYRNFEQEVFVINLENNKTYDISNTGLSEADPVWSPDSRYIYFEADRENPAYPYGFTDAHIYRIALEKFDDEFKSDHFDKLFEKEEKEKNKNIVKIDFNNLADRWEAITTAKGNQLNPYVTDDKEDTKIIYSSNQGDNYNLYVTTLKPFEKPETKEIEGAKAYGYQIVKANSKYYILSGGSINELKLDQNKIKAIDIDYTFNKNLMDEFKQMYYEVWANLDENYYDADFHGVDWKKMEKRYEKFLPFITSRADLRTLLNDLEGELNSSHQGFYSNGKEEKTFYSTKTLATGIIFENENPFKVKYIVKDSPADKINKNVKQGDELIAVNRVKVDPNMNREFYFNKPTLEDEITLTFKRGAQTFDAKYHPESSGSLFGQLYDEWINFNKKYVDENSDNKIAYVYMKNMGGGALNQFFIDMTSGDAFKKKGLIFDIRNNTGGNVHDKVLQFLSQRPYLQWKYRNGKYSIQPNFTPSAHPIVLLINEQTLSDGEMTAAGFKALGLGKIIGTETYRWIIFTSGNGLVDGSFYRLPSWGCYTLDGKDLEHTGVSPDIYVDTNFKDRLDGKDPQLDRAIEEIKSEWKK
ncbi:MAG TPA: S41 family peptidase [Ignavibacteriaceae bacterium]|nr:S41 family peptidase [Ignavibacteriaceae bacterium]